MYMCIKQLATKVVGTKPDVIIRAWASRPGCRSWCVAECWKIWEKVLLSVGGECGSGRRVEKGHRRARHFQKGFGGRAEDLARRWRRDGKAMLFGNHAS